MEDIAMKEELLKKANEILEKTKNEQEKYEAERKIIYWLMEHVSDEDINMLEYMERLYEKISKIEKENEQYIQVKGYIKKLKNQRPRKRVPFYFLGGLPARGAKNPPAGGGPIPHLRPEKSHFQRACRWK